MERNLGVGGGRRYPGANSAVDDRYDFALLRFTSDCIFASGLE